MLENAARNFNAGAVIATPKGNFLCKKPKSCDLPVYIVKIGLPIFCTAYPFTQTPNMFTKLFSCSDSPKVPLLMGASASSCITVHVPWTRPSQYPKLYLDQFTRFCTVYGRETYTLQYSLKCA